MEVLEAIQKRRTVRVPFHEKRVAEDDINTMLRVSQISPSGGPVSWRLVRIADQDTKVRLARIVKEDFGDCFQKNAERFRSVFSRYPRWLRFGEAQDGIRLAGFPGIAKYIYAVLLSKRIGPLFGKMGVLNAEIKAYCANVLGNPLLFGVLLNRNAKTGPGNISPIINTGSMLQNLRLAATSLGLAYQDLGWITATKESSEKARRLLRMPDDHAAVNFFRVGYADQSARQTKQSGFRRELKDIVHFGAFGKRGELSHLKKSALELLDAICGKKAERGPADVSREEICFVLEAARWAPTGFNVQPFEFIVDEQEESTAIVVLEDRERRDPDPGPCEALARGGVLQNIRLAARAQGFGIEVAKTTNGEKENIRSTFSVPQHYSIMSLIKMRRNRS